MTPDSFSDGGKFNSIKKATQRIKIWSKLEPILLI